MANLGDAFIDLREDTRLGTSLPTLWRARIERALMLLAPFGGLGVLWFPPGEYRVETGWTIPATATLAFAPGAVIVPMAESANEVLGIAADIDAELFQIFATAATHTTESVRLGRVALVGDGNQRVYPEWWGASRGGVGAEPEVDTQAIEAALRAAVIDREALGAGTLRGPVVVYLGGSYVLTREIVVQRDGGAAPVRAVSIEGPMATMPVHPFGETHDPPASVLGPEPLSAGLRATLAFERLAAPIARSEHFSLLRFERVLRLDLQGVSFDASGRSSACVVWQSALSRDPAVHEVVIDRCAFMNATVTHLIVRDDAAQVASTGSIAVAIRRSQFLRREERLLPARTALTRTVLTALVVDASQRATLDLSSSLFQGWGSAAVVARCAAVGIVGCRFATVDVPEAGLAHAVDVVVLPALGTSGAGDQSFEAMGCVSTSPSFLAVRPPLFEGGDATGDNALAAVLTGVTHLGSRADGYSPPSVVWQSPLDSNARTDLKRARLWLMGCTFGHALERSTSPPAPQPIPFMIPRVFVNAGLDLVFNVGTFRREDGAHAFGKLGDTGSALDASLIRSLRTDARDQATLPPLAPLALDAWLAGDRRRLLAWAWWRA